MTNQSKQPTQAKPGRPRKGKKQRNNVVRAPIAQNQSSSNGGKNRSRYKKKERVATIVGSKDFKIQKKIYLNPAQKESFPWLSTHASLYDKYVVHNIRYIYRNLVGTASSGNVILSTDTDALDSPPSTAIEQCQSCTWKDGAPWRIFDMKVRNDRIKRFLRSGVVPFGADQKTYDMGVLYVSTEGCQEGEPQGILEVEYDIELMDTQSSSGGTFTNKYTSFFSLLGESFKWDANNPIHYMDWRIPIDNPLGITIGTKSLIMPKGIYQVTENLSINSFDRDGGPLQFNRMALTNELDDVTVEFSNYIVSSIPESGTARGATANINKTFRMEVTEDGQEFRHSISDVTTDQDLDAVDFYLTPQLSNLVITRLA